MTKKRKRAKFWKLVWDDSNIILAFVSLIAQLVILIINYASFAEGSRPLREVALQVIVLVFTAAAFALFVRKTRKLARQLESTPLPVCFVVEHTAEEAQQDFDKLKVAVSELTGFKDFDKIDGFESRSSCLIAHERDHLPPDMQKWKGYIAEAMQGIKSFANGVSGDKVYHILVHGPITLALGLGAVFGTKHRLVFYQYQGGPYVPVLNLTEGVRRVKEHLPAGHQYRYFEITYPETYAADVAVVLCGASHGATAMVSQYLRAQGTNMSMVVVDNKYHGNLTETDWLPAVQELFSVFTKLSTERAVSSYHLFYSLPLALGFGLGMALGHFLPVTLYNLEVAGGTYYPVLKLNDMGTSF